LPDFLIIGAQKGGTTSLYMLLKGHPLFNPPSQKEPHFFDSRKFVSKGSGWYRARFPDPQQKEEDRTITGEASPYYLFHPLAARRAAQVVPDAKLIAMLRNPVDRAYSDYRHRIATGIEDLSFEGAIEAEEERLSGEEEKMISDELYISRNHRCYGYLSRGIYVDQIKEWHRHFAPEQMLILKSEDFFEQPLENLFRVQRFLGLSEHTPETDPKRKANRGSYEPMNPETRRNLEEFFEPHNQRIYEYLGVDFGW